MLRLLITIVGLVVGWGMVDNWGMVNDWGMMDDWGMVDCMMGYYRGMMNCMMGNHGSSMYSMVHSRGSMMNGMSTECSEWHSRATGHKRDKRNQSKDLHDVAI